MPVTDELRRHIALKGSEAQLRDAALSAGMLPLGEDGLQKVKVGVTTPEELLRVVTEVRETKAVCPACGVSVARDFVACPACGHSVGGGCRHCGRPMQPEWKFCAYCAKSAAPSGQAQVAKAGVQTRSAAASGGRQRRGIQEIAGPAPPAAVVVR